MQTYTKKEIAHLIQCSLRTIHDDISHLGIKPIDNEDYGTNIYSEAQYQLISSLRKHCRDGGKTRETFIPPTPVEVVEPSLPRLIKKNQVIDSNKQFIEQQLKVDPLYDLELLQRIVDRKWLLPTKRLAAIINVNPKTLTSRNCYNHCGYFLIKQSYFVSGSYLWKVKRDDREK